MKEQTGLEESLRERVQPYCNLGERGKWLWTAAVQPPCGFVSWPEVALDFLFCSPAPKKPL